MYISKDDLERIQIALALISRVVVIGLAILAYMFRDSIVAQVGDWLTVHNWRFEKAEFLGVTFAPIQDDAAIVAAANQALTINYQRAIDLLDCLDTACSEAQKTEARALISRSSELIATSTIAAKRLASTINDVHEEIVRVATESAANLSASASSSGGRWIVVAGADKDLGAAQDEIAKLTSAGFGKTGILLLDGWYRTIAYFETKADANTGLPLVSNATGRDGYVRSFAEWCPTADSAANPVICDN